jgi:hypothetical protein
VATATPTAVDSRRLLKKGKAVLPCASCVILRSL